MANIDFKEIFTGIKEDFENEYAHNEYNTENGYNYTHRRTSYYRRRHGDPNTSSAIWKLYMPNILAFSSVLRCVQCSGERELHLS